MVVWRLQHNRFPLAHAEGARFTGARWNLEGTPVIYTSQTMSLAALEVLVHHRAIPLGYIGIEVTIPDDVRISTLEDLELPEGWAEILPEAVTAEAGPAG
jgi:RES domain-containing protein